MKIKLIQVPYHLGQERTGMGMGPIKLVEGGLAQRLAARGHSVEIETVSYKGSFDNDVDAIITISKRLAEMVERNIMEGYYPFVLSGNCYTSLGILSGIDFSRTLVVWFDAHCDFNTPETTISGFLDGMSLAIVAGLCHEDIWEGLGNSIPLPASHIIHIGCRDFDSGDWDNLKNSNVHLITANDVRNKRMRELLLPKLQDLHSSVQKVYLHIDIDVFDPTVAPAVDYPCKDGLFPSDIEEAVLMVKENFPVRAVNLTAFNPFHDKNNKTLSTGIDLITSLVPMISCKGNDANKKEW